MRELISFKETMAILGVKRAKLNEIIHTVPDFPAYMIGKRLKIDKKELYEWINSKKVKVIEVPERASNRKYKPRASYAKQVWKVNTPGWDQPKQN